MTTGPVTATSAVPTTALALLLADGRFPDGSHAHSFGLEAAVAAGRVTGPTSLRGYVEARLWTSARTDAAAARLATMGHDLNDVDVALELRMPSATARATSRSLGRSLGRTAKRLWPGTQLLDAKGRPLLQPVAFGAVAALAGATPDDAAVCVVHACVASLSTAALRLLGLDPFDIAAVTLDLRDAVTAVARSTGEIHSPTDLPSASTPFAEIDPELQLTLEPRLFGS